MNETSEQNEKIEKWVFAGNFLSKAGKVISTWLPIGEDGKLPDKTLNYTLKVSSYAIGGIYEVKVERNGDDITVFTKSFNYVGQYQDADAIKQMKADQLAFEQKQRQRKMEAKFKKVELPEDWREIVELYKKVSYFERSYFEELVLHKLRKDGQNK